MFLDVKCCHNKLTNLKYKAEILTLSHIFHVINMCIFDTIDIEEVIKWPETAEARLNSKR